MVIAKKKKTVIDYVRFFSRVHQTFVIVFSTYNVDSTRGKLFPIKRRYCTNLRIIIVSLTTSSPISGFGGKIQKKQHKHIFVGFIL